MDPQFWHDRWRANEIGFHLEDSHPLLRRHWPARQLPHSSRILVPLCGKTPDLEWLGTLGYEVVGIELSEVAAAAFFAETGVTPTIRRQGPFAVYQHDNIRIFAGDFFAADASLTGLADAVYDRAALIALPPEMRAQYVNKLSTLVAPGARILLISLEYAAGAINAPPFAVDALEVTSRFGPWCRVTVVDRIATQVKNTDGIEVCYDLRVMAAQDRAAL